MGFSTRITYLEGSTMSDVVAADSTTPAPTWRIKPSVPVAIGVFVAYALVFHGLTLFAGVTFDDRFSTGANAFRGAVIPLLGGGLVLILFLLWARWDFVFKDPERLPIRPVLWVPVVLYALAIVAQFAVVDWTQASDRLLAVVAAGLLVGFTEETLFRGIILRSLRTNGRPEAWAMLITTVWFGLFHLFSLLAGLDIVSTLIQCFLAAASGAVYFLFRRARGLLVMAMLAHGLWDMSLFLPAPVGSLITVDRIALIVVVISAVVAVIAMLVRDRSITVTRTGVHPV